MHFSEYYKGKYEEDIEKAILNFSSKHVLALLTEFEDKVATCKSLNFLSKIKICFKYNIKTVKLFKKPAEVLIPYLQKRFYDKREAELKDEEKNINKKLKKYSFDKKIAELTELSMKILKDSIALKYGKTSKRMKFNKYDLWKSSMEFAKEYPVILSTTYSIKNSLNEEFMYDYVIVDEASQVDIATGVLAMSCAKNIVIVGDLKQLPNVVTEKDKKITDFIWNKTIGEKYRFSTQSFLSSACLVWEEAPSVLLREHYRCDPQIINFCNQKFYNNELIIMTESSDSIKTLALYKTPVGNHERNRMNQREIDVIKNEVLPSLSDIKFSDIGIIAPYRNQVEALKKQLPEKCEVDTVHKFQGREKDAIILSSVDNSISSEFVDDPHLLNVAISRAVKTLIVVTSGNKENENTNYGDLAKYISYNNFQVIESKTHSVFDLLYRQYFEERMVYLKKHKRISQYDSENLMYSLIEEILKEDEFNYLNCACHVSLINIIKDYTGLSQEEKKYAKNPLTHTDFLLFNKMDKASVLAIEVDGVSFHEADSRQHERDLMKNHIFEVVEVPLLRLPTDESNEKQRIKEKLREIQNRKYNGN